MHTIRLLVDDYVYRLALQKANAEGVSLEAVVRDALEQDLTDSQRRPLSLEDLGFVGIGRSDGGDSSPVSENHDEALARALEEELAEKRPTK